MKYARGGMTSLDYLMEIQQLENELKKYDWVSVKDKSPEKTGTYIVYMANGFGVDVYIEPQHTWAFNQASITHWMPFELVPPKEDKDETN